LLPDRMYAAGALYLKLSLCRSSLSSESLDN
jgi:hypothetical protein